MKVTSFCFAEGAAPPPPPTSIAAIASAKALVAIGSEVPDLALIASAMP